jgi:hypothetical protein
MKKPQFSKVVLLLATSIAALAGCSLTESEPDGSDLASQSCSGNLLPLSASSQIVPIGISPISFDSQVISVDEIQQRAEIGQTRSILSAKAAAVNKYWQPLADAWALEEAFVRAALKSLESEKISDDAGLQKIDTRIYDEFVANVNIDFAAVTKDTYCRIAFVKQNIEIKYEN